MEHASEYVSYDALLSQPDEFFVALRKHFPDRPLPIVYYLLKGDLEAAMWRMDELAAKNPAWSDDFLMSYLTALKGDKNPSQELLEKVVGEFPMSARVTDYHHFTYDIACIHAINGNGPEAMRWLRLSADKGLRSHTLFARERSLDKTRHLPEFRHFMAGMRTEYEQFRDESR